jgi:hypothetical protein
MSRQQLLRYHWRQAAWEESPSYDVMYINHYRTKSQEDFQKKKKRGGGAGRVATDVWFDRINREAGSRLPLLRASHASLSTDTSLTFVFLTKS